MSYTGREVLQAASGISKEDFEVIAWLTGELGVAHRQLQYQTTPGHTGTTLEESLLCVS